MFYKHKMLMLKMIIVQMRELNKSTQQLCNMHYTIMLINSYQEINISWCRWEKIERVDSVRIICAGVKQTYLLGEEQEISTRNLVVKRVGILGNQLIKISWVESRVKAFRGVLLDQEDYGLIMTSLQL